MANQLTKQQRHAIYKSALILLRNEIDNEESTVICPNLCILVYNWHGIQTLNISYFFPEFYEQKPRNVSPSDEWWPQTEAGINERIKALEKAIELTQETP